MKQFLIAMIFLLPGILLGQDEPKEIVEAFFINLTEQNSDVALDLLYSTNPWMSQSQNQISQLKLNMQNLTEDFVGKIHGYEQVGYQSLTDRFIMLTYLVRFDRQPFQFSFQFYKPDQVWRIHSFNYSGDLSDQMESAMILKFSSQPKGD